MTPKQTVLKEGCVTPNLPTIGGGPNDFLGRIVDRITILANTPLNELRAIGGYNCQTRNEAIRYNSCYDRGEMIAIILLEEFWQEEQP